MKIVYNDRFGGYRLSKDAVLWLYDNARKELRDIIDKMITDKLLYNARKEHRVNIDQMIADKIPWKDVAYDLSYVIPRHDVDLVRCVEELGDAAGEYHTSHLVIEEIHGRVYKINEYDGKETVVCPDLDEYVIIDK